MNQGTSQTSPLLRRITLFSSGLGLFEHSGEMSGGGEFTLPFHVNAVNDALKSLTINDPSGGSPSVSYASETTLERTLRSLKIDLSGDPGIARILSSLKGAEMELFAPSSIKGKIIAVEYRERGAADRGTVQEPWLSLFTPQGIRVIALADIVSFTFTDPEIEKDLARALDLMRTSRDTEKRNLDVRLPGEGRRTVSLGYIIPAPVWKVSYRLDLEKNEFQGWAIVDNDSDIDWRDVELALVTGRPASFIQNLYPPYYVSRPTLPLAIAGIAAGKSYDSGWGESGGDASYDIAQEMMAEEMVMGAAPAMPGQQSEKRMALNAAEPSAAPMGSVTAAAGGRAAGDQFEFTLEKPVSLARQQSAMLPLLSGPIEAEKVWIFSGAEALRGGVIHPAIGARLTNTTGMKLPAGPVTVFSGGTYGGDALLEFFPEKEKRIISFGDDLSVSGSVLSSNSRAISTVTVAGGIMTISLRVSYERKYHFKNASGESKKLIIEHPVIPGAALKEGQDFSERTDSLYRFVETLEAKGELDFTVIEESPTQEQQVLSRFTAENFLSYSSNQAIPPGVRDALRKAAELKRLSDEARTALADLETQRTRQSGEQDRIRRNLEAAGNQSPQGQEYLRRMAALDNELDSLALRVTEAEKNVRDTANAYSGYLAALKL